MTAPELSPREREAITQLPPPESTLSANDVLAARRTPRRPSARGPLALAAAALLVIGGLSAIPLLDGEDGRTRGGSALGAIHIEGAAEGPEGLRPLKNGDRITPDERVLFRVTSERAGWLTLREGDRDLESGVQMSAGTHTPGGERPQTWRPDGLTGSAHYTAWICPDGQAPSLDHCAMDELTLVWE